MNSLRRLSHTLAGGSSVEPLRSPPEGLKPFPATTLPATRVPPTPRPSRAPTGAPTLLTAAEKTQSVRAWASELAPTGPSEATIHYRLKQGWSAAQALGLAPAPARNRTREQAAHAVSHARVVVFERSPTGERVVIPRSEVATRLGIKLKSVAQKLRAYRPSDGSQAWIEFATLLNKH